MGAAQQPSEEPVFVSGIHAVYPEPRVDDEFWDCVVSRLDIEDEEKMAKLRAVNKRTGIKSRPVILDQNDPYYHSPEPYQVEKLTEIWLDHGIPLSYEACLGAIEDWGGNTDEITHLVATTSSVHAHPGLDAYIANKLGLHQNVSRTLLSGVGCAGGVALLRTAFEFAMAMTCRDKAARILVVACDLNSLGFRSDLEQLERGNFPVGLTLFSDAAAAAVLTNDIGLSRLEEERRPFEVLQWMHQTIPNSLNELRLMPTSIGPVSTISKKLPEMIASQVHDLFFKMISSMPKLIGRDGKLYQHPSDFEWDVHPGGVGVFDRIIQVMDLTRDNTTATINTYENWGNSAAPTVLKVLDVRRNLPVKREYIVCCGFGNNVDITMLIMRRQGSEVLNQM